MQYTCPVCKLLPNSHSLTKVLEKKRAQACGWDRGRRERVNETGAKTEKVKTTPWLLGTR